MTLMSSVGQLFFSSLFGTTPFHILEQMILGPLELYESIAILPVSFLRRHVPILGGTLVVLMTLHGISMRLFIDMLHAIFARITYSRDLVFNYRMFWIAMRDRYAFFSLHHVDWTIVHQLFGVPLLTAVQEDDLWIALQQSIGMCDDSGLRITRRGPVMMTSGHLISVSTRQQYQQNVIQVMKKRHLTDGGRCIANHFIYGILNAETSPGWRIGYIALNAMEGFVDFPFPDVLLWSQESKQGVIVPEIYDLESMRWALEAILCSLGEIDGLILDLRCNLGGGDSVDSALAVGSFFVSDKRILAFQTDEKVPNGLKDISEPSIYTKKRKYYIPQTSRGAIRYTGPLAILQSCYTKGTAELLILSMMNRPKTCRIGSSTAGCLAQTHKLRLPNYWTVEIPNVRCFSADGELYEGRGIPTQSSVERMEENMIQLAHLLSTRATINDSESQDVFDPCIKKAMEHIMNV